MRYSHAIKIRDVMHKASESLSDNDAYEAMELIEDWKSGIEYPGEKRLRYGNDLYKTKSAHRSQSDWTPDIATSLYEKIPEPGQGDSPSSPIAYNGNMALENGKYYSQFEITYLCIRDTVNPVYNNLADLVGLYVEVVNQN